MSTERFNIIFKDYPETYTLSEARNKKYYRKSDKLGKGLQQRLEKGELIWTKRNNKNQDIGLFDNVAREFLYKNTKTAGTPRVKKINGQHLWESGPGQEWNRQKLKNFLFQWFTPSIIRQGFPEALYTPKGTFIHFEYIFYYAFANKENYKLYQDYLNHAYVYSKVFEDTLVALKILPDDGPQYVRGGYARYVDIMESDQSEQRRLEIKVHFCKNNERIH